MKFCRRFSSFPPSVVFGTSLQSVVPQAQASHAYSSPIRTRLFDHFSHQYLHFLLSSLLIRFRSAHYVQKEVFLFRFTIWASCSSRFFPCLNLQMRLPSLEVHHLLLSVGTLYHCRSAKIPAWVCQDPGVPASQLCTSRSSSSFDFSNCSPYESLIDSNSNLNNY